MLSTIFGIIIGIVLSATISSILAANAINSKDVYYQDNSNLGATNVQDAIDNTNTKFDNKLISLQTTILNKTYPVGSVYTSVDTTSPATLFGGTWERISGRFLLSADDTTYKINTTGGEATHVLTIDELPSHTHTMSTTGNHTHTIHGYYNVNRSVANGGRVAAANRLPEDPIAYIFSTAGNHTHTINNTGSGVAHNNMPPYLVVYMWKRTK